jgi:hypothetical protein
VNVKKSVKVIFCFMSFLYPDRIFYPCKDLSNKASVGNRNLKINIFFCKRKKPTFEKVFWELFGNDLIIFFCQHSQVPLNVL